MFPSCKMRNDVCMIVVVFGHAFCGTNFSLRLFPLKSTDSVPSYV
jgi:hypothetical protein